MKKYILALLISAAINGYAQKPIDELVNAEKTFAQLSKDKGTKEAFLTTLADSGLLFRPGPVNGKQFWQQQTGEDNSMLTWQPVAAGISASGDFGYTTGPFQQYQHKKDEQPAGGGSYISIWKKEKGEWKVVLDIGISHPPVAKEIEQFSETNPGKIKSADAKKEIFAAEAAFIKEQKEKGWIVYPDFLSATARLYRPQSVPIITGEQRKKLFSETDKKFIFENTGGDVSASGDMAYLYGKTTIEITKDGNTRTLNGNYLRIWTKEGAAWKIVSDLVNLSR